MIDHISIQNFAIIENTEMDLESGLNIVTGETGAGKSIVIEAVSLALGARADSSYVRRGTDKALIELVATLDDGQHVISREVSSTGKNICRLDGRIATLSEVQEMARKIADIHGQYDNQILLDPERHIDTVDLYQEQKISPIKDEFLKKYHAYKDIRKEYDDLVKRITELNEKKDFLEFESKEIERVDPKPGEDSELKDKISILENSENIYSALASSSSSLEAEDSGVLAALGRIDQEMSSLSKYSGNLKEISGKLTESYYALQDAAHEIKNIMDTTDFSREDLDRSISRLDELENLKKKYGPEIDDVLKKREEISDELYSIDNFDDEKKKIEVKMKAALSELKEAAAKLTAARKASASILSDAITKELAELNFGDASFNIEIRKAETLNSNGFDEAEMMISTNAGEPQKPLAKIASGGEISRVMLAIKTILGGHEKIPTMIFDEIDAGISGITASTVARKLLQISKSHQIICITHLPQIAAAGDHNLRIFKDVDSGSTYTHVEKLDLAGKTEEIARLIGGDTLTESTLTSSRELISSFDH